MKTILYLTLSLLFYFTVPVYAEATQEEQGITAEQWLYRGDKDLAQHHYTEAILDYSKAIELNPGYVSAYVNRGNAYFSKKQFDAALNDYTQAIALAPSSPIIYYNRGTA